MQNDNTAAANAMYELASKLLATTIRLTFLSSLIYLSYNLSVCQLFDVQTISWLHVWTLMMLIYTTNCFLALLARKWRTTERKEA